MWSRGYSWKFNENVDKFNDLRWTNSNTNYIDFYSYKTKLKITRMSKIILTKIDGQILE